MKEVYVLCPSFYKTGGTELLHQLVWALNQNNKDATICYYGKSNESGEYLNQAFKQYVTKYVLFNDVKGEDAYFVLPEVKTDLLKILNPNNCVIWWESVNNYKQTFAQNVKFNGWLRALYHLRHLIVNKKIASFKLLKKAKAHFVQSYYARDYLKKHGIVDKVFFLKDYVNNLYIEKEPLILLNNKENIVLYNPKKGKKTTARIIKKNPDLKFVPLIKMTNTQVQEMLSKAKVYIDFGSHPGMDRFPREAAMMHCCVITNKCGSAKFYEDVPIGDKYKFDDSHLNYKMLRKTIDNCFTNYLECDKEFDHYRDFIKSQYDEFIQDAIHAYQILEEE